MKQEEGILTRLNDVILPPHTRTYDDEGCTCAWQITESTFWTITLLKGQQANRDNEISDYGY